MDINDKLKYKQYREGRDTLTPLQTFLHEILLPCLLFGSLGAITWAIRGTAGWGGFDGALIPGFMWGILWVYLMYRRGVDGRAACFWIGLGIALGGMLGYGQYVSWIRGEFYVNGASNTLPINILVGYSWLMMCGVAWGGVASIFLGWSLTKPVSLRQWCNRIITPFIFVGLGVIIIILLPSLIFPHYSIELYTETICPDCSRTVPTNITNFLALMWWIGALFSAMIERNKITLKIGLLLGVGFGLAFSLSTMWTYGYVLAPGYIDWWKMWELSTGFFGGITIALALYLSQKEIDNRHEKSGEPLKVLSTVNPSNRRKCFLLTLSLSILLLMMYYGSTYNLGIFLGLYDETTIDQYELPIGRIFLVIPGAIIILTFLFLQYKQISKASNNDDETSFFIPNFNQKMMHLFSFITFFGVLSIWPSKILAFYVACLWLGIYILILLDKHLPKNNRQ